MKQQRGRIGWIVALLLAATAYHFLSSGHQANAVDSTPAWTPSQAPASPARDGEAGIAKPRHAPAPRAPTYEEIREREAAACQAEHTRAIRRRMTSLAHSADARERASYAVMVPLLGFPTDERLQRQAFGAALELAPDDAQIAWLAAQDCRAPGCDSRAAIERLLRIDSGNAFAWLLAVGDEFERGDLVQADRLLQRAARAPRVDGYFGQTALLVTESIGPLPQTPACARAAATLGAQMALGRPATMDDLTLTSAGSVAALHLPSLRRLYELCPGEVAMAPHRLPACRALFARLASSDVLLFHSMGTGWMATHATTPVERAQWRERARNLHWMMRLGQPLLPPLDFRVVWEEGEVPVMIAMLEEAGRWPAPADWQPDDPG